MTFENQTVFPYTTLTILFWPIAVELTIMFSIVKRSPRRCRAFPPTATTKRCFFFGLEDVVIVVVIVVVLDATTLGAADVDSEKYRADKQLIRNTSCLLCETMMKEWIRCIYIKR
jgi:hypothetical protein